jgi:hypothetical protein
MTGLLGSKTKKTVKKLSTNCKLFSVPVRANTMCSFAIAIRRLPIAAYQSPITDYQSPPPISSHLHPTHTDLHQFFFLCLAPKPGRSQTKVASGVRPEPVVSLHSGQESGRGSRCIGTLQDAGAFSHTPLRPRGFGVRLPSAAFSSVCF